MKIITNTYKANDFFALVKEPHPHPQHPNQRKGLDLYVSVINLDTGEHCHKKLYENTKGLHFKHTGYSPMYLHEMTRQVALTPYQYTFTK